MHGPSATFEVSAVLAFAATVLLALSEPRLRARASLVARSAAHNLQSGTTWRRR